MKYSCWADGTATFTSYTLIICRLTCYHSPPTYTGPFHMVSLTSLNLSSSCLIWLEHGPTQGMQESGHKNNYIVMPITDESIDEQTPMVYAFYA